MNRRALLSGLVAVPAVSVLAGCRGDAAHVLMGMQAPAVRGITTDGLQVDFAALGKATLVRFWGLWCGPCTRDEAQWQDVIRALHDRADLSILSVHVANPPANGPTLAEWAARQPAVVKVPVVDDSSEAITRAFGIPGTPSTLLIDATGRVVEHAWAFKSGRGVRSFVQKASYILDNPAAASRPAAAR
jgi:thiol-disulfide isomerase/thioredoxin